MLYIAEIGNADNGPSSWMCAGLIIAAVILCAIVARNGRR